MSTFETTGTLTNLGFIASFLTNCFLNYITIFHIKHINGTYKLMILNFSTIRIVFSGLEVVARPFAHNYNNSVFFFSPGTLRISPSILQLLIASWAGCYLIIVSFIAVQFVYRYLFLSGNKKADCFDGFGATFLISMIWIWILSYLVIIGFLAMQFFYRYLYFCTVNRHLMFEGRGTIAWMLYPIIPGMVYVPFLWLFCRPDEQSDNSEMKKFSAPQRRLQRQYFKALVVQCVGPTVFLIIPAGPVLLTLMFSQMINFDYPSGWLFSTIWLYPPFDSISFMIIVTDYRKIIKKKFKFLFARKSKSAVVNLEDLPRT
ncbi:Protein CBG04966 [Caenorhabditis briggsae]|uniref:Protein CBG04966 n=1 Tax=Caenorhabditis briggsae TaxID=6238 RepID=A8WYW9_CAEBR|nr:Protein CBG04966 [Caenorhabditis briggsae]CAP25577.1 Protein CBG04966 [Caenorhabditis briggsae]